MRLAHVRSAGLRDMGYLSGSTPAGAIGPNHAREAMPVLAREIRLPIPERSASGVTPAPAITWARIWRANSLIAAT